MGPAVQRADYIMVISLSKGKMSIQQIGVNRVNGAILLEEINPVALNDGKLTDLFERRAKLFY